MTNKRKLISCMFPDCSEASGDRPYCNMCGIWRFNKTNVDEHWRSKYEKRTLLQTGSDGTIRTFKPVARSALFAIQFEGIIVNEKLEEKEEGIVKTLFDIQKAGGKIIICTYMGDYSRALNGISSLVFDFFNKQEFAPYSYEKLLFPALMSQQKACNKEKYPPVIVFNHIYPIEADYYIDNINWPFFPGWEEFRKTFLKNKSSISD
jgi:hypothetical protein